MRDLMYSLDLIDVRNKTIGKGECRDTTASIRSHVSSDIKNIDQNSPDERGFLNFFEYDLEDDITELMFTGQREMFKTIGNAHSLLLQGTTLFGYRDEWRIALWQLNGEDHFTQEALMGLECLEAIAEGMT